MALHERTRVHAGIHDIRLQEGRDLRDCVLKDIRNGAKHVFLEGTHSGERQFTEGWKEIHDAIINEAKKHKGVQIHYLEPKIEKEQEINTHESKQINKGFQEFIKTHLEQLEQEGIPAKRIHELFGDQLFLEHFRNIQMHDTLNKFLNENPDAKGKITGLIGAAHKELKHTLEMHGEKLHELYPSYAYPPHVELEHKLLQHDFHRSGIIKEKPTLTVKYVENKALQDLIKNQLLAEREQTHDDLEAVQQAVKDSQQIINDLNAVETDEELQRMRSNLLNVIQKQAEETKQVTLDDQRTSFKAINRILDWWQPLYDFRDRITELNHKLNPS